MALNKRISGGESSVVGEWSTAVLGTEPGPILRRGGSDEPERLIGTARDDVIEAGGGNDRVLARAGNDLVFGGAGDDLLEGEAGNDTLFGDEGNDRLMGGEGDDILSAISGNNVMFAGTGNDTVSGGSGFDFISGGLGNDILDGGAGNDIMHLEGDSEGFDQSTHETAYGGDGDDSISTSVTASNVVYGGEGNDVMRPSYATTGAPGEGNDTLFGDAGNDDIYGGNGDDLIYGGDDLDVLRGGLGSDIIYGGEGGDSLLGDAGDDVLYGGGGDDILSGGASAEYFDVIYGGNGNDTISGADLAFGRAGDDTIFAWGSTVHGDEGDDEFINDQSSLSTRADTYYGGIGFDVVDYRSLPASEFSFSTGPDGAMQVTHIASGVTDLLYDVELITFS